MPPRSTATNKETLQPSVIRKIRSIVLRWGVENYQEYPWRDHGELWHRLIAEVLLQRTRARNVVKVYESFIKRFPKPIDLASASVEDIVDIIYPLGLRWRAPLLKRLGEQLVFLNGQIPLDIQELQKLAGVGFYIASAWLSFNGGKRTVLVDSNVVRWICRLVGKNNSGEVRRQKWLNELADKLTPKRSWKLYNYAVLDFTMYICTKVPKCNQCPIDLEFCKYRYEQARNANTHKGENCNVRAT